MEKIFEGLSKKDLVRPLACFQARRVPAKAGEIIVCEGVAATRFGVVMSGAVNVVRYSPDGRERLLAHLGAGEAFGTSFVLGGADRYFANIVADGPTEVLLLNGARVLAPCSSRCAAHMKILCRLLAILARRNSRLAQKIDCLSQRTTAGKLMAYLHQVAADAGRPADGSARAVAFDIPFTRQQLADYLNVDRAALSTVIGQLEQSGRLHARGRHFVLPNAAN